jgi:glycosyltransferase involved in cell wall biosynthesis
MNVVDPVLGFMHNWVSKLAEKFEFVTVICLERGEYNLPSNVKVLSLGKEQGASRGKYLWRFYKYIWLERKNYDAVFVHMNQEYVLLGWKIWWLLGKPVYMWRNHHAGNLLTDIAAFFCKKVFCTSKYSYTTKYKKTVLMPVGVDLELFKPMLEIVRAPKSILFLGRIAQVKRPDLLIDALIEIKDREWSATIVGDALPQDQGFYQKLVAKVHAAGLDGKILFKQGIANTDAPRVYSANEIFVNLSSSGMYDKTIFEAMACGCLVLASNENLRGQIGDDFIFADGNKAELISKLIKILNYSLTEKEKRVDEQKTFAAKHDIKALINKIYANISQ